MPIPAVTLKQSTTHSSQNWGVLIALDADTLAALTNDPALCGFGVQSPGVHPGAGTRTNSHPRAEHRRRKAKYRNADGERQCAGGAQDVQRSLHGILKTLQA